MKNWGHVGWGTLIIMEIKDCEEAPYQDGRVGPHLTYAMQAEPVHFYEEVATATAEAADPHVYYLRLGYSDTEIYF